MIRGHVNEVGETIIRLKLRGADGEQSEIDAMIDTGFTSALTLPASILESLKLTALTDGTISLADGSERQFDIYTVQTLWDGQWCPVIAWAMGEKPLIGRRLLAKHALFIEMKPAGAVVIDPLP